MARGRMITNLICKDKKVHALSDDTARLLFTWLITVADCEGRTYGDPAIVKATIFPRRTDITADRVDGYLNEMYMNGLIVRYIVDDEQYIYFPAFEKNQIGLRKDREAKSEIPPFPLRSKSGVSPEELPVKLIEVNRIEVNRKVEEADSGGLFHANTLSTAFEKASNILAHSPQKWMKAIDAMQSKGATPEDITDAVNELRVKGYNIIGPWSIENAVINVMGKRKSKTTIAPPAGYTEYIPGD